MPLYLKQRKRSIIAFHENHFARARDDSVLIHGCFLRSGKFSLQNRAIQRSATQMMIAETPSIGNRAQASENARKNSFMNYKSAALSGGATDAELAETRA